jgi:hypothetical protein
MHASQSDGRRRGLRRTFSPSEPLLLPGSPHPLAVVVTSPAWPVTSRLPRHSHHDRESATRKTRLVSN